jgi:ligand-binding sensor domain-containing protein
MRNIFNPATIVYTAAVFMFTGFSSRPGNLVNGHAASVYANPAGHSGGEGIPVRNVNCVTVDGRNIKWFGTDTGIVSFDGMNWKLHVDNKHIPNRRLKGMAYVDGPAGPELWIATPNGATVATLPIDERSDAVRYDPENASMLSENVLGIAAGKDSIRWIGTDRGISALVSDKWLTPYYDLIYPEMMFKFFPITSMASNAKGDSLYAGTAGAGVARVYRDSLDGISGASVYAIWGPIILPSDNIQSIFIAPDGTKWFGTTDGIARHTGNNTLDNWTVYTTDDGLVDNFVQAITGDKQGNIWFGTKAGISVFNGSSWISYTTDNGLASNNILSIATDNDGIVWIGTDAGITSYENKQFVNYLTLPGQTAGQ